VRRPLLSVLFFLAACSTAIPADTPGEEAVKDAVKTLKVKRAAAKDKADQALLDTAIRDLEERLAQVGKGEPGEEKKGEPFVLPKGWELKFNTGKTRPTYDQKTGEMKLAYDFSDAKQLKDFEFDDEVKPAVQKGTLTVKGGCEIKHVAKYRQASISFEVTCGSHGHIAFFGDCALSLSYNYVAGDRVINYQDGQEQIISQPAKELVGKPFPVNKWFFTPKLVGLEIGGKEVTAKRGAKHPDKCVLTLAALKAPNIYRKLTISGVPDPDWAKEFFADKK